MRALIIGGTGLISSAITMQLVERGVSVALFNRGHTRPSWDSDCSRVEVIHGDRNDSDRLAAAVEVGNFDLVVDMVCFCRRQACGLRRACRGRVSQVMLCSSVEVYSPRATPYPVGEEFPCRPVSAYGMGKVESEGVLRDAEQSGDFAVTILRPAYTYGEGTMLISALSGEGLVSRLRGGRPVVVAGDGRLLWTACHRDDVAKAFVGAAGNSRAFGRTYNVTGTETMCWNDYYLGVAEGVGRREATLVNVPLELLARAAPGRFGRRSYIFRSHYVFDSTDAAEDLGFRQTIDLAAGLERVVPTLECGVEAGRFEDDVVAAWRAAEAEFLKLVPCDDSESDPLGRGDEVARSGKCADRHGGSS